MPAMDSTAKAALDGTVFAPAFFLWLDVSGDPIRITTFGKNFTFASTGDPDLDGFTFNAFDGRALQVGDVANTENGSDTLTIELSGIVTIDTALLADIGNKALWQGRLCRLWFAIYDADGVTPQGAVVPYYTGYMSSVEIVPSAKTQSIRLQVENYLVAFNQASNRSYLNQKDYDAADNSAAATIASANMGRSSPTGTPSNSNSGTAPATIGDSGYLGRRVDLL